MTAHLPTITRSVWMIAILLLMTTSRSYAIDYVWNNASGGNWNVVGNWTPGGTPGSAAGDTATIALAGTYTVTLNINPVNPLLAFTLNSTDATFSATGRTLNVTGISNVQSGFVIWNNSTWNTGSMAIGFDGEFIARRVSTISTTNLTNLGFLVIEGGFGGSANLTISNGFTNQGAIILTNDGSFTSATLTITAGTLTNALNAVLIFEMNGTNFSRLLNADLVNNGTVTVEPGVSAFLNKTNGIFTNNNTFTAVGIGTFVQFGTNATFNQNGGTLATTTSPGLVSMEMISDTFNFNGGNITGNGVVLIDSALNIGASSTGSAVFTIEGTSTLSGNVAAAQTIGLQGDSSASTLTAASSFTNSGTITLTTSDIGTPTLAVTTGTLTNAVGGNINLLSGGSSGVRTLNANVANAGTITVTANNARIDRASGTHTNSGTIFVDTGAKLSVLGASSSFTNQPTGVLSGTGEIDMSSSGLTFVNNGITAPGASAGILTFRGSYNQSATGEMRIELGGTTPGTQHDQLAVIGTASINGTLTVTYIGGFTPGPGDTFTILTSTGARTGTFSVITPGDFFFDIAYNTNSIVLTNFVPVPEPSFIVLALGLLIRRSLKKSEAL